MNKDLTKAEYDELVEDVFDLCNKHNISFSSALEIVKIQKIKQISDKLV